MFGEFWIGKIDFSPVEIMEQLGQEFKYIVSAKRPLYFVSDVPII